MASDHHNRTDKDSHPDRIRIVCSKSSICAILASQKVLVHKKDYIILNKYKEMMIDAILDNINHIINGSPSHQIRQYFPSIQADKDRWTRYQQIAERLRERIRGADPTERESGYLNGMKDLKVIYQDVILQNSNNLSQYDRSKRYEHYLMNAHLIKDDAIRKSLDNLLSLNSELGQCRQILRNIEHNFKEYLNIKLDNTIYFNLSNIESLLFRTKGLLKDNILSLGELNATSILLDQISSKIEQNKPLNGFKEMLQEDIKTKEIKTPLAKLFELLESNNINLVSLKDQQNIVKEINVMLDIGHKERELTEGLHEIKRRVSQSEEIVFEHFQKKLEDELKMKVLDEIISELSVFVCGSLTKPLSWLEEKQLRLLKDSFQRKIIETKIAPNSNTNHYQSQRIEQLERQTIILRNKLDLLQESQSQLTEHLFNKKTEMKNFRAKYTAIFTILKKKILQLKSIKEQLHTQFYSLRHFIEDQKISTCKEISQKINEDVEGIRKHLTMQKQKEIQKVEERRRAEKNKLSDEYAQIFSQLTELKERYYTEITAKLLKSNRFDMSMSRMDNVETNDCAVGSSFMLLENSILNEESIGVGPDREEEQEEIDRKTEEQLIAQINKHFQNQTDKLKKKIGEQEEVISIFNKESERNNEQLKEERARQLELQNELLLNQKILSQKDAVIIGLLQNIKKLKAANLDYESTVQKLHQTANTFSPHMASLNNSSVPLFIPYNKVLFQGEIFSDDSHLKDTLIKHITAYMKTPILKTHLLHKFDPNNKANFHLYIDNKKHLICVVKTNNAIIAGFYPGQLKEGVIMNEGGLLVSVTNDQSYQLMQKKKDSKINYRGMTYDPYYVIFGNAEMRVRSGEKRVFCNFGIQNSYFDYANKPRNIQAFLNDQNREVEFSECEFYQLIFQQPYPPFFDPISNLPLKP